MILQPRINCSLLLLPLADTEPLALKDPKVKQVRVCGECVGAVKPVSESVQETVWAAVYHQPLI